MLIFQVKYLSFWKSIFFKLLVVCILVLMHLKKMNSWKQGLKQTFFSQNLSVFSLQCLDNSCFKGISLKTIHLTPQFKRGKK